MIKYLFCITLLLLVKICNSQIFVCGDTLVDQRDGQKYQTVQIGNQCWMKSNLNIGTRIDGIFDQTNNLILEKYCYDNDTNNCVVYGALYQWDELMQYSNNIGAQGICPNGWHIPTEVEFDTVIAYTGGNNGNYLLPGNIYGFDALSAGYRENMGQFLGLNGAARYWTSLSGNGGNIPITHALTINIGINITSGYQKILGHCVRCIADNFTSDILDINMQHEVMEITPNPMTDVAILKFRNEKNEGFTLQIFDLFGKQVGLQANLKGNNAVIEKGKLYPGVYLLKLSTRKKVLTGKLIIE